MPAFLFFFRKAVIPPPILAIHACKILSFSITGQELSYRTKAFFLLDAGERGGLAAPEKTKMIICSAWPTHKSLVLEKIVSETNVTFSLSEMHKIKLIKAV